MSIEDSVKNLSDSEEFRRMAERARARVNAHSDSTNNAASGESIREFLAKQDYSDLRRLLAPHAGYLHAMATRAYTRANADYS